jgi:hypothetical protein
MKTKVYFYAEYQAWDDKVVYKPWRFPDAASLGVFFYETEVDIPEVKRADLINGTVKNLRLAQQVIRAEAQTKVTEIEQQIGELLAIEDKRGAE